MSEATRKNTFLYKMIAVLKKVSRPAKSGQLRRSCSHMMDGLVDSRIFAPLQELHHRKNLQKTDP